MKKYEAAVALDSWKLNIFEKALAEAGYTYIKKPGLTPDTLTLKVPYDSIDDLEQIVRNANAKAAKSKMT